MDDRSRGVISEVNLRGYARIIPAAGGPRLVVHRTDLRRLPFGRQLAGLQVYYRTAGHRHGRKAIDVEAANPADVVDLELAAEPTSPTVPPPGVDQADVDDQLDDEPDGAGPSVFDPTPAEIEAAAAQIRDDWSPGEYRRRAPHFTRFLRWTIPGAERPIGHTKARRDLGDD